MPRALNVLAPGDLRVRLADARTRGVDFDAAWKEAITLVRFPRGGGVYRCSWPLRLARGDRGHSRGVASRLRGRAAVVGCGETQHTHRLVVVHPARNVPA